MGGGDPNDGIKALLKLLGVALLVAIVVIAGVTFLFGWLVGRL